MSDPTPTINAVAAALRVMAVQPDAIAVSRRSLARMKDESRWLGMQFDQRVVGASICGVKLAAFAREDLEPDAIDIRDLDGNILMRVASDDGHIFIRANNAAA